MFGFFLPLWFNWGESDRGRDATKSNRVDLDPGTVLQDTAAVYGVHTTNQAKGHSLEDYFITVGQGPVMFVKPAKTVWHSFLQSCAWIWTSTIIIQILISRVWKHLYSSVCIFIRLSNLHLTNLKTGSRLWTSQKSLNEAGPCSNLEHGSYNKEC